MPPPTATLKLLAEAAEGWGCGERKVFDIVRGKWPQGMRGAAKGLVPLQRQEMPMTLSDQCNVDLSKLLFKCWK